MKAGIVAVAVIAMLVWITPACSSGKSNLCDAPGCPNPGSGGGIDGSGGGIDAGDAGDAMADGPTSPVCPGQCLPYPPVGWGPPELVWIGPQPEAPPCPDPLVVHYQGSIDLDAGPLPCGQCGCAQPDGGCGLPTTLTASAATCGTMGNTTPFDAPPGWDGGCTAADRIDGGAASLTIEAPTIVASGCTAIQPSTPAAPPTSSYVVSCVGDVPGAGGACALGFHCLPPATGFYTCVASGGDHDCPGFPYTEKRLAFVGVDDTRNCSPCTCGAPSGGKCTTRISIYPDSACTSSSVYVLGVDSTMPEWCFPVTAGPLLSKSASPPVYVPGGSCQPAGGVPGGSVTPTGPLTFCCIPSSP